MRRPLFLVKVRGESMWPFLVPGRTYWASGWLTPRAGDYAVAVHPHEPATYVVKKMTACDGSSCTLDGTVPWSSSFTVPCADIAGVLLRSRF